MIIWRVRFTTMNSTSVFTKHSQRWSSLILAVIVAAGAWLRFTHLDWDEGYQLHPDERAILYVAQDIEWPVAISTVFDLRQSPANPFRTKTGELRDYPYGHLPLYLIAATADLLESACRAVVGCQRIAPDTLAGRLLNSASLPRFDHLTFVARGLSALADTLTIAATYVLAKNLMDRWAGLLAASLVAFAVLPVQNAHFGTVDSWLALFSTLAVLSMIRAPGWRRAIQSGLFLGLAIGCKITGLLLLVPLLAAELPMGRQRDQGDLRGRFAGIGPLLTSLGVALVAFAVTNPYALLDPLPFIAGVVSQFGVASGAIDVPFTRQYADTIPILYMVDQQGRWTLGAPFTVAGYAGTLVAIFRAYRTRSQSLLTILAWIGAVFVCGGMAFAKLPRYFLAATPALACMAASLFTIPLGQSEASSSTGHYPHNLLRIACALIVVAVTANCGVAFVSMYSSPHPWLAASRWVYAKVPPYTVISVERWDDALPLDIDIGGQMTAAGQQYVVKDIDWFALPDDPDKLERNINQIALSDYIILASNRLYGVIPRLKPRYPLSAAYYRLLFSGQLGFVMVKSFERYPHLLGITLYDDPLSAPKLADPGFSNPYPILNLGYADESFTVYDHPRVLIFKNVARLPAPQVEAIVTAAAGSK